MPRKTNGDGLTRAGWIRQQVLLKPDITLEEMQKAYDKTTFPKKDRPKEKQVLYQANNQIRNRWGVDPVDIPRKNNGEINMAAMVRLYIDRHGDTNESVKPIKYFLMDGLELKPVQFSQSRSAYMASVEAEPDENQEEGPRAGAPDPDEEKPKRKPKRRGKARRGKVEAEAGSHLDKYQEIEAKLDKLIAEAESMKAWPLASDLRNARRRAGTGVLTHS